MNSSNDKKSPKEKSDGVSQLIKAHIKAHFTLGIGAKKKLGANFEHFGLVVWPQVTNKCWNIGPKGCKLASQIWWYLF